MIKLKRRGQGGDRAADFLFIYLIFFSPPCLFRWDSLVTLHEKWWQPKYTFAKSFQTPVGARCGDVGMELCWASTADAWVTTEHVQTDSSESL